MPRPRFNRLDEATQRRIIETAAEEFAADGYDGASLNHIIDKLGLSKGSFYYYFDDKADLLATVLERAWKAMLPEEGLEIAALEPETFWPRLREWVRGARELARARPWLVGVSRIFYHPPKDPQVAGLVAECFEAATQTQIAVLRRGREIGVVRDDLPEELLLAILTAADTACDRWLVDNWSAYPAEEIEAISERCFDLLERLLRVEGGGDG